MAIELARYGVFVSAIGRVTIETPPLESHHSVER
jgi:hypothetical protein